MRATRLASAAIMALGAAWVAPSAAVAQDNMVRIDGSSTVYPVTEAVAEEFQASTRGKVRVTVGISGTGGGFKKFTRGETDISNASRPILEEEMALARQNGIRFIELPVAFDALTVIVHPKNTWVDHLTVEELKKVWSPEAQGAILNWNQVRPGFPDMPLRLYGAGSDSGTFDYFTEAINGKAKSSRGDFTASEDDNVLVQGVSGDTGALGYFGFAYYVENKGKLKSVPISANGAAPIGPSEESVINGSYQPLSRPIFIYVNAKSLETKPEIRDFAHFYLENVAALAKEVGYVPLPESAYEKALERLKQKQTGTVFGGHAKIGAHIDELFTGSLSE